MLGGNSNYKNAASRVGHLEQLTELLDYLVFLYKVQIIIPVPIPHTSFTPCVLEATVENVG